MKSEEFHRMVERNGWTFLRKAGSHVIYKKGSRTYPVPYHGAKEMGTGLVKNHQVNGAQVSPFPSKTHKNETDFGNH